jgi:hexosaminidase
MSGGMFSWTGDLSAGNDDFAPWCLSTFGARLEQKNIGRLIVNHGGNAALRIRRDSVLSPETYTLDVRNDGIVLSAGHERGVVIALTTLFNCIDTEGKTIPCFKIRDKPRYAHRGFMLDCVRHFFNADEIEKVLEEMALVKLNVFHWNLSNDQGWRIESRVFPKLNEVSGPCYTQDEIRRIVNFAKERGIEVIPEIDVPGHTTALIAAFPELSCKGENISLGKSGGIYRTILCAGKESTYTFLFDLFDEAAGLFESPYFHLGGDEAPKVEWEHCEHCKAALEKNGLAGFEDLQGYFTVRMADHLAKKGKRIICWNDILKAKTLPQNMDIQHWIEWDEAGRTESFLNKGGNVVFSDMFHLYFDYPESFIPLEKVYGYTPVPANAEGVEACLWTEGILTPEQLQRRIFPRLFALAESAWSGPENYDDFERRLRNKAAALDGRGVAYTPLSECNPRDATRVEGIMRYYQGLASVMGDSANMPPPEEAKVMRAMMSRGFNLPELPF